MDLPNYKDGSIVNLMSSIAGAFGSRQSYKPLRLLPPKELKGSRNIVLLVLDGIGFEYVRDKGKNTVFTENLKGKMTSVFPATTASAITTFATGTAPQQHAFTGWFMHLKEIGIVSKSLPFSPRAGGLPFSRYGIRIRDILDEKGFTGRIRASAYTVIGKNIVKSDFSKETSGKAGRRGYSTLNGLFRQVRKAIKSHNRRKYIYAYWPEFDSLSHKYGVNSRKTEKHFREICRKLKEFIRTVEGTDTTLIITSDHGFVDTAKDESIMLEDHPRLKECLTLPLCGGGRVVYCYVHPGRAKQFERYVKTKLGKFCHLYKSKELVDRNYFGLFRANPKLLDRIGDYALLMKGNYTLKDRILGKKRFSIGNHGGMSREELLVPLVIVKV